MMAGLKQTTLWRFARGVKRELAPPRAAALLAPADCRSAVVVPDPPAAVEAGRPVPLRVRVENLGSAAWAADGPQPVRLVATWTTCRGEPFGEPTVVPLSRPVYPGEPQELAAVVPAPLFVGDFTLTLDLAQPDGRPFADRNPASTAAKITPAVVGPRATDIDYHEVYRTADLGANHWWVVGRYHSQDEYERSKAERRGMLVAHGLSPDAKVLDVGCGTGQMADALAGYLTDRGGYCGTDIGREAIDFCRRNFTRPNFHFRVGGMTRVPFTPADGPFDLAVFFSVFTHTFVDETVLLLDEVRRLLRPGGRVVADVITSPLVERGAGHRGEMVVNREHFERLAAAVGFAPEVIGRWAWNPHAERLMYVLRNAERGTRNSE